MVGRYADSHISAVIPPGHGREAFVAPNKESYINHACCLAETDRDLFSFENWVKLRQKTLASPLVAHANEKAEYLHAEFLRLLQEGHE